MQSVSLGIGVSQLSIDLWFTESLARHLEITYKIIMLIRMVRNFDDLYKIGWVLSLDVRI